MPETLSGGLSMAGQQLTGRLSVRPIVAPYVGDYEVAPKVHAQTLQTANRTMVKDLVVTAVPYHETTNLSDGLTVHIAEEV